MKDFKFRSDHVARERDGSDDVPRHVANDRDNIKSRIRFAPILITLGTVAVAALLAWATWVAYMAAPWTRDGTVRAFVVTMAPEVARKLWAGRREVVAGGQGPGAKAIRAEAGWRVGGTWSVASGSRHATWLGAMVSPVRGVTREGPAAAGHLTGTDWFAVGYLAVAVTAAAFIMWHSSVRRLGASPVRIGKQRRGDVRPGLDDRTHDEEGAQHEP